jgi:hypothetical protein
VRFAMHVFTLKFAVSFSCGVMVFVSMRTGTRWLVSATRGHVGVILFGLPLASSASNSQFASLALLVYTHKHQQKPVTNLPSAEYLPDGLSDSWVSFRS